ncbi:MAG TPA: long-chain-fatty-acid--CoA ligase, partial [Phenylobacterium sp.]|nr:long-chain-fatty-acid--CoA ligase [Phenylobacterium sp.]
RTTYAQIHERAKRLSNALKGLGVQPGDRVATLAWNTGRHIETWYGIMGIGAVCHTLNPRLFADQLCYIINHAEDKVIFTDLTFLPILLEHREKMPCVKHFVVMTDEEGMKGVNFPGALCFETLVNEASPNVTWGGFDENTAAGLCYTSGTTGNPKGVLYSHRSNFIHTLVTMSVDVMGISATDTILPVVPMFHANAWGLAFSAPAVGAKLVMPGQKLDGASVYELLESEGVTFSAAVPTVWQMLLAHLRDTKSKLSTLKRVVIGGSAVPESIVRGFHDEFGVDVTHAWGMTETSPLGTLARPLAHMVGVPFDEEVKYKLKQGRPPLGIDLKLEDDAAKTLPHDGTTFGKLKVKGPFVVREYFKGEGGKLLDREGFFDTGDVATIDATGFMQITDRAKDVIKSGGEWISTIEIENIAAGHPKAALAAVIGVAHPKWDERPLLLVKLKEGESAEKGEFLSFLEGKIAKWWMPDDVAFVDDIPLGATGKIDKKLIRERMKDYVLPTADGAAPPKPQTVAFAAPPAPKIYAPEPAGESPKAWPQPAAPEAVAPQPKAEAREAVAEAAVSEPAPAEPVALQAEPEPAPFPTETFVEPPAPEAAADVKPLEEVAPAAPAGAEPEAAPEASGRERFARRVVTLALIVALAPAVMVLAGLAIGRASDVGEALLYWAPRASLISVGTGLVALAVALFAGFQKLWLHSLAALGVTIATLAGFVWFFAQGLQPAPVYDVTQDASPSVVISKDSTRIA